MADILISGLLINVFVLVPIGALIGHLKRGRWRDGALLAFGLGVFGLLLIPTLKDKRRLCEHCRSKVPEEATKCRHCGGDLRNSVADTSADSIWTMELFPKRKPREKPPERPQVPVCCDVPMEGRFVNNAAAFVCGRCGRQEWAR